MWRWWQGGAGGARGGGGEGGDEGGDATVDRIEDDDPRVRAHVRVVQRLLEEVRECTGQERENEHNDEHEDEDEHEREGTAGTARSRRKGVRSSVASPAALASPASPPSPTSSYLALADRLEQLRALSPRGFVRHDLRRAIWPLLLGIDPFAPLDRHFARCITHDHRSYAQVDKDVERSFNHFDVCKAWSEAKRERMRARLGRLLHALFSTLPDLHYIQGLHDIVSVLLLVLGQPDRAEDDDEEEASEHAGDAADADDEEGGDALAFVATKHMALMYLRDTLSRPSLDTVMCMLSSIFPLLELADFELYRFLTGTGVQAFVTLSFLLTWFSHNLDHFDTVVHFFDFFLASHPTMPMYMCAALLMTHRHRLLALRSTASSSSSSSGDGASGAVEFTAIHTYLQSIEQHEYDMDMEQLRYEHPDVPLDVAAGGGGAAGDGDGQDGRRRYSWSGARDGGNSPSEELWHAWLLQVRRDRTVRMCELSVRLYERFPPDPLFRRAQASIPNDSPLRVDHPRELPQFLHPAEIEKRAALVAAQLVQADARTRSMLHSLLARAQLPLPVARWWNQRYFGSLVRSHGRAGAAARRGARGVPTWLVATTVAVALASCYLAATSNDESGGGLSSTAHALFAGLAHRQKMLLQALWVVLYGGGAGASATGDSGDARL